jgi:DNA-binding Lrp family transcriptional regulator
MPDLESYERFLVEKLTRIPGIDNIQTSFALKPVVARTELPLAQASAT